MSRRRQDREGLTQRSSSRHKEIPAKKQGRNRDMVDCGALREGGMYKRNTIGSGMLTKRWLRCGGLAGMAVARCWLRLNAPAAEGAPVIPRDAPAPTCRPRPQ